MTKVNCTVSGCRFWTSGNICGAEEILVENDFINNAGTDYNVEFAEEPVSARTSAHTRCETMNPKDDHISGDFFKETPGLGIN